MLEKINSELLKKHRIVLSGGCTRHHRLKLISHPLPPPLFVGFFYIWLPARRQVPPARRLAGFPAAKVAGNHWSREHCQNKTKPYQAKGAGVCCR
jgi:hypothetical protein